MYVLEFIIAPSTVILFPGEISAQFLCLINPSVIPVSWEVNGRRYGLNEIFDGDLPGHNVSGSNLTVSSPMNGTKYVCVIPATPPALPTFSDPAFLYIAGKLYDILICFALVQIFEESKFYCFHVSNEKFVFKNSFLHTCA